MPTTLLVTTTDEELPEVLKTAALNATFTTHEGLATALKFKSGALLLLIDEAHVPTVLASRRGDLRAVVLVQPRPVPSLFPRPVVAVVERPIRAERLLLALRSALAGLPGGGA